MAARKAFLAVVAIVASVNLGCGGKIEQAAAGDDAGKAAHDPAAVDDAALVVLDATSPQADTQAVGGDGGPCSPIGMGASYGSFVSMNWITSTCASQGSCIEVVNAVGCSLKVQLHSAVVSTAMSADDCARLGAWMTSDELIGAVKRGTTCPDHGGNPDVLDLQTSTASTSYKAPSDCTDQAWVDHRACMNYLIGKYGM